MINNKTVLMKMWIENEQNELNNKKNYLLQNQNKNTLFIGRDHTIRNEVRIVEMLSLIQ